MDKEENTAVEMHLLLPSGSNIAKNDFEKQKEWGWNREEGLWEGLRFKEQFLKSLLREAQM